MDESEDFRWVATLSDGTTAVEKSGEYSIKPGERKPWVRLCSFLVENDLHLTSLRLVYRGRTIHLPRPDFGRFDLFEKALDPHSYSLQYHMEADTTSGSWVQSKFIDLAAHFEDDLAVHYIHELEDGNTSWIAVTRGSNRLAQTPRAKVENQ
jgi:hypothetical protein